MEDAFVTPEGAREVLFASANAAAEEAARRILAADRGRPALPREVTLDILSGLEEVPPAEWEALQAAQARPSPFLSPRFLLPWRRAFGEGCEVRVVRMAPPSGPAEALLFLCRCGEGGWTFLGGEQVADYLDALVVPGREEAFWRENLSRGLPALGGGPLRLPGLVEGTPALSIVPRLCREAGIPFRLEEMDRAPYIGLPASFEALLFLGIRGGTGTIPITQSAAHFSSHPVLNWAAVNSGPNLYVSLAESRKYINVNPFLFYSQEEAAATVAELHCCPGDSTVKVIRHDRPNIVVVLLESWTADLVESLGGKPGISPRFAALEKEGLLFTSFYASGNR